METFSSIANRLQEKLLPFHVVYEGKAKDLPESLFKKIRNSWILVGIDPNSTIRVIQ